MKFRATFISLIIVIVLFLPALQKHFVEQSRKEKRHQPKSKVLPLRTVPTKTPKTMKQNKRKPIKAKRPRIRLRLLERPRFIAQVQKEIQKQIGEKISSLFEDFAWWLAGKLFDLNEDDIEIPKVKPSPSTP